MKSISFSITTIYRLLISLKSLQFFYTHTFLKKVKEKWKNLFKNEVILWIRFRKILPKTYPYYLLGKYAVVILDIENLICNRSSLFGICWWFFEVITIRYLSLCLVGCQVLHFVLYRRFFHIFLWEYLKVER